MKNLILGHLLTPYHFFRWALCAFFDFRTLSFIVWYRTLWEIETRRRDTLAGSSCTLEERKGDRLLERHISSFDTSRECFCTLRRSSRSFLWCEGLLNKRWRCWKCFWSSDKSHVHVIYNRIASSLFRVSRMLLLLLFVRIIFRREKF